MMRKIYKSADEFRNPYCPNNHYKPEVGILANNRTCLACHRARQARYQRLLRRKNTVGLPPPYQDGTGIRGVREYLGMDKREFATAIGCWRRTVVDWEEGTKRMRRKSVLKIMPHITRLMHEKKQQILKEQDERAREERVQHIKRMNGGQPNAA